MKLTGKRHGVIEVGHGGAVVVVDYSEIEVIWNKKTKGYRLRRCIPPFR